MADMQASQVQTNAEAYAANQSEGQFSTLIPDAATIAFLNAVPGGLAQSVFNLHQTLHAAALVDSQRQLDPLLLQTYPGISEQYDTNIRQFRYTTTHRSKADKQNGTIYSLGDEISTITGDWFVSSLRGDDSNNGRSFNSPKQTISAINAVVQNGEVVVIEDDSEFSELLQIGDNCTIKNSKTGTNKPLFEGGKDIQNSEFSLTGGQTNTWQFDLTPDAAQAGDTNQVIGFWQGDRILKKVESLAEVETTEGSYYYANIPESGVAQTIYVHPVEGVDPTVSEIFSASNLRSLLIAGNNCTVEGISFRKSLGKDSVNIGSNAHVTNSDFSHNVQHSLVVTSGIVENCNIGRHGGRLTFYKGSAEGESCIARNNVFGGGNYWNSIRSALFNHVGAGGLGYDSIQVEGNTWLNRGYAADLSAKNLIFKGNTLSDVDAIRLGAINASEFPDGATTTVENNLILFSRAADPLFPGELLSRTEMTLGGSTEVKGNRIYADDSTVVSNGIISHSSTVGDYLRIYNNSIKVPASGFSRGINSNQDLSIAVHHNVLQGGPTQAWIFANSSAVFDTANWQNNVYFETNNWRKESTSYTNLADVIANFGVEQGSVAGVNPGFLDLENGDFTTTATEVDTLQAGFEYYQP